MGDEEYIDIDESFYDDGDDLALADDFTTGDDLTSELTSGDDFASGDDFTVADEPVEEEVIRPGDSNYEFEFYESDGVSEDILT